MRKHPRKQNEMQKLIKLVNILLFTIIASFILLSCNTTKKTTQIDNEKLNFRIAELANIGYSLKASRKIAFVEFGICKADREYKGLIND